MRRYSVFVSSSDSYSDLWDVFFDMFHRNWPDFNGEIVLNTQKKVYTHPHLNIKCTHVGYKQKFGETFRAGLEQVKSEHVLLLMIDYLFMGRVDNRRLNECLEFYFKSNIDSLCLVHLPFAHSYPTSLQGVRFAAPPYPLSILFSYQAAIWKKDVLYEMVLPHEDPWMSEWYGSKRAEKMGITVGFMESVDDSPLKYNPAGCVHKGRWLDDAVDYLNKNYEKEIDYSIRGLYNDNPVYEKFSFRIYTKWIIWKTGFLGSYWDLLKRKPIH